MSSPQSPTPCSAKANPNPQPPAPSPQINLPLMDNNITREDLDVLIDFLKGMPRLTQSKHVEALEKEWSDWLGVKHSVFVNSGASANLITMAALKHLYGGGEIIVPPLTWVSDIASVIQNGFKPVFVDINPNNLCMNVDQIIEKITDKTKAVFLTYVQGFNGLTEKLLKELEKRNIPLIEDVCESHGATFNGQKLGSFGLASNFSFFYAHHMSTIEGGMVCTNSEEVYETIRSLRSHGMIREAKNEEYIKEYTDKYPDLNPDFIFAFPAYNVRNTEIGAVIGRNQLKRLDENNKKRTENLKLFLGNIDPGKYRIDFDLEGCSNYAFNLVLKDKNESFRDRLEETLRNANVEFRRGSAGGGNQMRQPYLRNLYGYDEYTFKNFPEVEHIHFFGYYIGNYPDLKDKKILQLCKLLNSIE